MELNRKKEGEHRLQGTSPGQRLRKREMREKLKTPWQRTQTHTRIRTQYPHSNCDRKI